MSKPDPIATSNLPTEIQDLIRQVVKRSRLWKRERHSLTLELLAHFNDGIDAGRSADDLTKTFGDPKVTAKLMRRAKERNRPLWWHFLRRTRQAITIFILLYLAQMAYLLTGRPEVKIDYAARMCEKAETIPESDRAWPIYRQAWLRDNPLKVDWKPVVKARANVPSAYTLAAMPATDPNRAAALEERRQLQKWETQPLTESRPGEPNWDQAITLLQQHPILLEAARAGGMKPGLGITLRERRSDASEYRKLFPIQPATSLLYQDTTMDCPEIGALSTMAKLLQIDIRWAASQNDSARVVQNYRASMGMCRQVRETSSLIGQLMGVIATERTDRALADAIAHNPDLLSTEQCVGLLHTMALAQEVIAVSAESQRVLMDDLLQRIYTDDGNGDGKLTRDGAELFLNETPQRRSIASALTLPLLSACIASRREMTQVAHERFDMIEKEFYPPLRELLASSPNGRRIDQEAIRMRQNLLTAVHYWPLSVLIPQYTSPGRDVYIIRAQHDALTVALAVETYRRANGSYPLELDALVPRYLPAIPLDPLADQPLLYALHDGKPVIYARGQDGQDHGGDPSQKPSPHESVPAAADWILFPPLPTSR